MKLVVQNLGSIKSASIDLSKRFYTFVGYNNSGKTYLANLVWCIEDCFTKVANDSYVIGKKEPVGLPKYKLTDTVIDSFLRHFIDFVMVEYPVVMGISKDASILTNFNLSFQWEHEEIQQACIRENIGVCFEKKEGSMEVEFADSSKITFQTVFTCILAELLYPKRSITVSNTMVFLPTERLSFMYFHKYFFRIEKERREEISRYLSNIEGTQINLDTLKSMSESLYAKPSSELIDQIYNANTSSYHQTYQNFSIALEKIMNGKMLVEVNNINGLPNFRFQMQDKPESIKLHISSSSVNQLATLSLFWKYWATRDNNFLIIDEPEQNLHPENQIKLTELLIQFANLNNNRVLITTHSPIVAEVINNYLILGQLEEKEEARKSLHLAENCELTPENTGIYFFTGESVIPYEVSDYGTVFRDFKAAQEQIWNAGYQLGNYMYQQNKRKANVEVDS